MPILSSFFSRITPGVSMGTKTTVNPSDPAALSAVLLGHRQPEEPELPHAADDRVREGRLLPLLDVGLDLALDERADRFAQRLVLVREDEPARPRGEIGLQDGAGFSH